MKDLILKGLKGAVDILLPRRCVVCGERLLLEEEHICLRCLSEMPRTFFWNQSHNAMSDSFNELIKKDLEPYVFACALFYYHSEANYRFIPYQIKYHSNIQAGLYFGRMLGRRLKESSLYSDVDIVIPVPLHWSRKWKRGYNQAAIIGAGIAEELGVPVEAKLLYRKKRTQTQTRLNVEEKVKNVTEAFSIHKETADKLKLPFMVSESAEKSDGLQIPIRHMLIVDDVFTTGSTAFACFCALREVFPASKVRISVATLGFVGKT